ncbi:MAG: selenide, water dikinase SelD [Planctomycetes bacterium]|nr:selenide, water dikinase SelD [Planctomycetota bacterium]
MSPKDTEQVLRRLPKFKDANLLVSMETLDDAGVYRLNSETALVQTVDIFTPIVDDPYDYGSIVAANSLSDVYAMGGRPLTIMNILGFPAKKINHDIIAEILRGGAEKVMETGAVIVGGHSMLDPELKYGMSVTGLIHPKKIITNSAAKEGDILILTKPLGIGIITMANSMSPIPDELMKKITKSMATLNKTSSEVMLKVGVNAATDITGFGLIGHASEVARGSKVTLKISISKLPVFEEAKAYARENIMPGGSFTNIDYYSQFVDIEDGIPGEMHHIAFDAQTSGGLLMSVPEKKAQKLLKELHNQGVKHACIIGKVVAKQEKDILLTK